VSDVLLLVFDIVMFVVMVVLYDGECVFVEVSEVDVWWYVELFVFGIEVVLMDWLMFGLCGVEVLFEWWIFCGGEWSVG